MAVKTVAQCKQRSLGRSISCCARHGDTGALKRGKEGRDTRMHTP